MRTIGLVGGMTPESTVIYYQHLIRRCRERVGDPDPLRNPEIVVYSIDLAEIVALQRAGRRDELAVSLAAVCDRLAEAGAEVGALTANTPHLYLDAIRARSRLELVSIVEAARDRAAALGYRRPLLLGTAPTMESPMYPEAFAAAGMRIVTPGPDDRERLSAAIFGELALGVVSPGTRRHVLDVCTAAIERDAVDAVILGCTELPLVLEEGDVPVPLLDTVDVHVEAILDRALA